MASSVARVEGSKARVARYYRKEAITRKGRARAARKPEMREFSVFTEIKCVLPVPACALRRADGRGGHIDTRTRPDYILSTLYRRYTRTQSV